jgi:hypothetical protein
MGSGILPGKAAKICKAGIKNITILDTYIIIHRPAAWGGQIALSKYVSVILEKVNKSPANR